MRNVEVCGTGKNPLINKIGEKLNDIINLTQDVVREIKNDIETEKVKLSLAKGD